jgi:hypothetical protein
LKLASNTPYLEYRKNDLKDYPLLNLGTAANPNFTPAEYVEILPGQSVKAKLTSQESTAMVDFACRSPYANALSITTDARETLGLDDEKLVCIVVIYLWEDINWPRINSVSKLVNNCLLSKDASSMLRLSPTTVLEPSSPRFIQERAAGI